MICGTCHTPVEDRRIPFGDKFIKLSSCRCGAERIAAKYTKTRYEPKPEPQPDRKTLAGGE